MAPTLDSESSSGAGFRSGFRSGHQFSLAQLLGLMTLFPIAMLIAHAWGPLISLAIAIAVIVFRYEPPEWNPVVLGVTYFVAILVVILLAGWMASSPSVERLVVAILLPALGYIVGFAKSLFVNP